MRVACLIGILLNFVFESALAGTNKEPFCGSAFAQLEEPSGQTTALQEKLAKKIGERALYQPVLSTDTDFLRTEVLIAEGPAPQKNMRLISGTEQFRPNTEAKAIFQQRQKLLARYPRKIIGVLKGQENEMRRAAQEQFAFMVEELPGRAPNYYAKEGEYLVNRITGDRLSTKQLARLSAKDALEQLGKFVPDDLIFMKKFGEEYRVIGGNLAFPTHWDMDFALGKTISEIHEGLSGSPESIAAFSKMINGVLDRTLSSKDVVRRNNWFIESDPRYALPAYQKSNFPSPQNINRGNYQTSTFFRTERQTMRGLPESKVVTFTICPYVFPMGTLAKDRELGKTLLEGIKVKLLPEAKRSDDALKIAKYLEEDLGNAAEPSTKVISLTPIASDTYALKLEKPNGLVVAPGEAIRVTIDTPSGPQSRILSLASSPDANYWEFATKDSDSEFKQAFKAITPGSKVSVEPMRSSLKFQEDRPAVLIAGGIGITPFRSFIQYAKDKNLKTPIWLFYANRKEIPFQEELAAMEGEKLRVKHVLSQAASSWEGEVGRIDKNFLAGQISSLPKDSMYYIVGAPQMTEDVQRALKELGVPEKQILTEAYPSAAAKGNAPIDAATAKACDTVCFCQKVSAGAIREAIDSGADSLEKIKATTKASTACGGCAKNILGFLQCAQIKAK